MSNPAFDWTKELAALDDDDFRLSIPLHVLLGEAADLAAFAENHWKGKDVKGRLRPGLESARTQLPEATVAEMKALINLAQKAALDTHFQVEVGETAELLERGHFVLGEIVATLDWLLEDAHDPKALKRFENLREAHATDVDSQDGLALALEDYAMLADAHRQEMGGLGGFDAALIDEAPGLAEKIRGISALRMQSSEAHDAMIERNRVLQLLLVRMNRVRGAARFVFRRYPDIARKVASPYERRRRAGAKKKVDEEPSTSATGAAAVDG